jgi:hypothetical protein
VPPQTEEPAEATAQSCDKDQRLKTNGLFRRQPYGKRA